MNQLLCIGDPSQNVMAESKGSLIAKSVSKHAGRAKEKVRRFIGFNRSFVTCNTFKVFYLFIFLRRVVFVIDINVELIVVRKGTVCYHRRILGVR